MKKLLFTLFGICCGAMLFAAATTTPEGWTDDYDAAFKTAREKSRPVLMLFTGSDWCPACIKLKREVLSTPEFKKFAAENFVLLYVDFPAHTKLPEELEKRNRQLLEKTEFEGFPTTFILAPDGKEIGHIVGCYPEYLEQLRKFVKSK